MDKAILAVSFGTAYGDTRKKTIGAIEADLAAAFPDRRLYAAWTSGMILRKLEKRGEEAPMTLTRALETMERDGVKDLLVQPTFFLEGYEMRLLRESLEAWRDRFQTVRLGKVLVAGPADLEALAAALEQNFARVGEDEVLALMGHGSEETAENPYEALNAAFRRDGRPNFAAGTVEFDPSIGPVLDLVRERKPKKVYLAPLMIVAGDHANNDMAGEEPESWKNRVAALGTEPECILRGLGEYPEVRALLVQHAREAE